MKLRADLHIHSTASDGRLSPAEVVHRAAKVGLSVMALTDHDSVEGVDEAMDTAREHPGLLVVPGVEINTDVPGTEVHVLGYCMDYKDGTMARELARLRRGRVERGRKMVDKLAGIGVEIDWKRVQELAADGSVGRPHVAQAMLEAGYVREMAEAFDKYIGRNCAAYVDREKITPENAVCLIVEAGGFAVLAHPHYFGPGGIKSILDPLVVAGLSGLEAYYDGRLPAEVMWLVELATKQGLMLTGGTDFHGFGGEKETPLGETELPNECVELFVSRARRHLPKLLEQWTFSSSQHS
ncbi:MAG: PHP domain-containing protein [Dehalococcoidia bacterium]|nr:PHP domain-containing protein [Dehalococcoidia bacterium]